MTHVRPLGLDRKIHFVMAGGPRQKDGRRKNAKFAHRMFEKLETESQKMLVNGSRV